jgi:hypothetical protein
MDNDDLFAYGVIDDLDDCEESVAYEGVEEAFFTLAWCDIPPKSPSPFINILFSDIKAQGYK